MERSSVSEFDGLQEHLFPRLEALGVMPAEMTLLQTTADVIDNPVKLKVSDSHGSLIGVVHWSPSEAPQAVAEAVRREVAMHSALGIDLGSVVLMATLEGAFQDRSYALYPWQRALNKGGRWSRLRNWRHAKPILNWLSQVHAQMFEALEASSYTDRVVEPVEKLRDEPGLDAAIRTRLDDLIGSVTSGNFVPKVGPVHNDMWTGNILLPTSRSKQNSGPWTFRLIDWGASTPQGFPLWDLMRIMPSLQMPKRVAKKILLHECNVLGLSADQGRSSLLLACADLGTYRNEFPLDRYLAAVKHAHDYFDRLVL